MTRPAWSSIRRDDSGSETMEFALVAPIALLVIIGALWAMLGVAARVSLAQAASNAARFASIPTDMVRGIYPDEAAVNATLAASTPFFDERACTTTVTGKTAQNAPVTVEAACSYPNPAGRAVGFFLGRDATGAFAPTLTFTASAKARRE